MEEGTIGTLGEDLIVGMINGDEKTAETFSSCFTEKLGIKDLRKISKARKRAGKCKTDIDLYGRNQHKVGLSLKTVTTRDDHHLDRRWLDDWTSALSIGSDVYQALSKGIKRKAENSGANLIFQNHEKIVRDFLNARLHDFLEEAFRKGEINLLLLGVIDALEERALYVFRIDETIDFIEKDVQRRGISFRRRVKIGSYIDLQRKAGNGRHIAIPKTDPKHPGNQIQIKLKPLALKNDAIGSLDYCRIKLPNNSPRSPQINLDKFRA